MIKIVKLNDPNLFIFFLSALFASYTPKLPAFELLICVVCFVELFSCQYNFLCLVKINCSWFSPSPSSCPKVRHNTFFTDSTSTSGSREERGNLEQRWSKRWDMCAELTTTLIWQFSNFYSTSLLCVNFINLSKKCPKTAILSHRRR